MTRRDACRYFEVRGRFKVRPGGLSVNARSKVAVSICELGGGHAPQVGLAHMEILNVAPHDDSSVTVVGHVHWGSPLAVMLNFIIAV